MSRIRLTCRDDGSCGRTGVAPARGSLRNSRLNTRSVVKQRGDDDRVVKMAHADAMLSYMEL